MQAGLSRPGQVMLQCLKDLPSWTGRTGIAIQGIVARRDPPDRLAQQMVPGKENRIMQFVRVLLRDPSVDNEAGCPFLRDPPSDQLSPGRIGSPGLGRNVPLTPPTPSACAGECPHLRHLGS